MKNANLKKILTVALGVMLVLSMVFVISSCNKEEHVHSIERTVLVAPTCTSSGVAKLTCSDPSCEFSDTEGIDPVGHDIIKHAKRDATCTAEGYQAYETCANCNYTTFYVSTLIPIKAHNFESADCQTIMLCKDCGASSGQLGEHDFTKATCSQLAECKVCGVYTGKYADHDYSAATCSTLATCKDCGATTGDYAAHDYAKATCSVPETCKDCGYTRGTVIPHDFTNPTCTTPATCKDCGVYTGSVLPHDYYAATCTTPATCKDCGHVNGNALGHTAGRTQIQNYVAPTCTVDGQQDIVTFCYNCPNVEIGRETVAVPATGHSTVTHAAQEPTCVIGWFEYETCTKCDYTTYVERSPIRNHFPSEHPVDVVLTPSTCTQTGTYYTAINCSECGLELSASEVKVSSPDGHKYVNYPGKSATCTEPGWQAYHTCSVCGDTNYTDLPARGHSWTTADCVNPSVCSVCNAYSAAPVGHSIVVTTTNFVDPTCDAAGSYDEIETCSTCQRVISRKTVVIQALGHQLYDHLPKSPTCTEVGWQTFKSCTRCSYSTYQDNIIPALGHTGLPAVTQNRVYATCTVDGHYDSVIYCAVCSAEVSREVMVIPAYGHNEYTYTANSYSATCTSQGYYETVTKCYDCRAELSRVPTYIVPLGHDWYDVAAKAPECKVDGYTAHQRCSRCGITAGYQVVYALGHLGVTVHAGEAPTCTTSGRNEWEDCSICGYSNFDEMYLPPLGHDMVFVPTLDPKCEEDGYIAHYDCSRCDHRDGFATIPATGHVESFFEKQNIVDPTCTVNGSYDYVELCHECNKELGRDVVVVNKTGHNYNEITGNCENGCGAFYTPALSFSLTAEGMVVTGMENTTATEIIIPETFRGYDVVAINARAFEGCTKITSVVIPDTVTEIGDLAFFGCKNLTTVTVGSGVKSVGANAFYLCKNLSTVKYNGTAADWAKISIDPSENGYFINANRVYLK